MGTPLPILLKDIVSSWWFFPSFFLAVAGFSALILGLIRTAEWINAKMKSKGFSTLLTWVMAVILAIWTPLVLLLLSGFVWIPLTLVFGLPPEDGRDLRWYLLTFTALTAALGALAALPFTIMRTLYLSTQTRTAEQSHVTDQISKAVEALGAEKTISRVGRPVKVSTSSGDDTRIEWQKTPLTLGADEQIIDRGDWQAFSETVPNTEVRIGAIYALERIAQDSLRDHIPIMEILTAYIRQNAPASSAQNYPEPPWEPLLDDATDDQRKAHTAARKERFGEYSLGGKAREWASELKADTIIQAAVQVIGRRGPAQIEQERGDVRYGMKGYVLDLRETNLQSVYVSGLNLSHALLSDVQMEGAVLFKTGLEGATLNGARLDGANLKQANLEGADLGGARMEGANLSEARMEGADGGGELQRSADGGGDPPRRADGWGEPLSCADGGSAPRRGADGGGTRRRGADAGSAPVRGDI